MEIKKQALMKTTKRKAKPKAYAKTKPAANSKVSLCKKHLKFSKSSANLEINEGDTCVIITGVEPIDCFSNKTEEINCLTCIISYDMLVTTKFLFKFAEKLCQNQTFLCWIGPSITDD
jgi:hypothetical protein